MKVLVVSDIHYASPAEQARRGHEGRSICNPGLRMLAHAWRHWVWLRDPAAHNHRLAHVIAANPYPDWVVANGDFTLDTAFIGVSDHAAYESADTALSILREAYGERLLVTMGDHELGKKSLFGGAGGLRLDSWGRAVDGLGISPFWRLDIGSFVLVGAASTPLALPVFKSDILPEEADAWSLVAQGLCERIREAFATLHRDQRIILFLHDPSAIPFLMALPEVRAGLERVACTVVGHLHTPAIFRTGSLLAGMPVIHGCGTTLRRYSSALRHASVWAEFRTVLCPSPAGIELLKDGGWLELELEECRDPRVIVRRYRLPWSLPV